MADKSAPSRPTVRFLIGWRRLRRGFRRKQQRSQRRPAAPSRALVRFLVERAVFLAAAVLFLRTWFFDGFPVGCQVSGGSTALTLLGAHRDVVRGDCGFHFACEADSPRLDRLAVCPNCGYPNILGDRAGLRATGCSSSVPPCAVPAATLGGDRLSLAGGGLSVVRQGPRGGPARRIHRNPPRRRLRRRPHPAENAVATAGNGHSRVRRK